MLSLLPAKWIIRLLLTGGGLRSLGGGTSNLLEGGGLDTTPTLTDRNVRGEQTC